MLVKKIKYEDFDGNEREEEFLFNLNKAEVFQWLMCNGGYTLDKLLLKMQKESKGRDIMATMETLILTAYGEKSLDGRQFIKSDEISQGFKATNAYSELFMELVTDAKKAGEFIISIIPKDLSDSIDQILKDNPDGIPDEMKDYLVGRTDQNPNNVVAMPAAPEA